MTILFSCRGRVSLPRGMGAGTLLRPPWLPDSAVPSFVRQAEVGSPLRRYKTTEYEISDPRSEILDGSPFRVNQGKL